MKKLSVICLLVVGIILISGCIDGEKTNSKTSTSSQSSINETPKETSVSSPSISIPSPLDNNLSASVPDISQPELMPGEFEINITSYYFVYLRDNEVISKKSKYPIPTFDLVEKNYAIYHLSIKNNDTNALNFSINKLQLHTGNQVFSPADPGIIHFMGWVSSEIENEKRLNDTLLHPDQTLEGIVIFQVDNYTTLFDRSFSLRYNTTSIPSTLFEKSLEALTVAEQFDYSIAFDIPPYDDMNFFGGYSYDPPEPEVSYVWTLWGRDYVLYTDPGNYWVWANWVNRSVFESYKKHDEMSLPKQKPGNIPRVEIAYAVKVIPEQDLTVFHTNQYHIVSGENQTTTKLHVVDDTGEALFNKSIFPGVDYFDLAILDNQTYRPFPENMPHMFIPQATIVHFSFYSYYESRLTQVDQDIILDEQHNIILARYDNLNTHAI